MKRTGEAQAKRAAVRIADYLRRQFGGVFPSDPDPWIMAMKEHQIRVQPVWGCPGLTAITEHYEEGKYLTQMNGAAPAICQVGCLAHEWAEVIAVREEPCFWDQAEYRPVYHHDGGDHPTDIRHRTAQMVERIVLREICGK